MTHQSMLCPSPANEAEHFRSHYSKGRQRREQIDGSILLEEIWKKKITQKQDNRPQKQESFFSFARATFSYVLQIQDTTPQDVNHGGREITSGIKKTVTKP